MYWICQKCKRYLEKEGHPGSYCDDCGSQLIDKCPNCTKFPDIKGARKCQYCGGELIPG